MSATVTAIVTVTATHTVATATATVTNSGSGSVYFEICWSILSTLGIFTTLVGLLVIGIVGFSLLALVPIVNSMGAALGNGLCWYAYYSNYSIHAKVGAAVAADIGWLIQEASLSFYSFLIVRTLLRGRERVMFHIVFWFLEGTIVAIRMGIIASRITLVRQGSDHVSPSLQQRVNHLHVGYFVTIACCESWNAYFLLRKFYQAQKRRESMSQPSLGIRDRITRRNRRAFTGPESIYSRLARSTEIRLALLAVIGIVRSITFTFQASAQSATNLPSQLDRFAACFECMFPIVFIVDLLASKLAFHQRSETNLSHPSGRQMSGWGEGPHKINVTSEVNVDFQNKDPFAREEIGSNYSEDAKLTQPPTVTIFANGLNHRDHSPTAPMRTMSHHSVKFSG